VTHRSEYQVLRRGRVTRALVYVHLAGWCFGIVAGFWLSRWLG
jgi:hypothetical protein